MTWTLDGLITTSAQALEEGESLSVGVHEIAGANVAYIQSVGKMQPYYVYSLVLSAAEKTVLKGYVALGNANHTLTDTVNGFTAVTVRIVSASYQELAPDVWACTITLAVKTV